MTRCTVLVDPLASKATLDLEIDFTRLMGDPVAYFELTRMNAAESASQRAELIQTLRDGLTLVVGNQSLALVNTVFTFPDLPLEKFTEPWAAPMAKLRFEADVPPNSSTLYVASRSSLRIEFPLVVTLKKSNESDFGITRWLEPGQKSPVLDFELQDESKLSQPATGSDSLFVTVREYFVLGFTHILPKGLDHILFVLGLFFLSHRWKSLLMQVSIFTVAHTITLMLTAVGTFPYRPAIVEPLIALSIVYVGVENIWRTELTKSRLAVVFVFGLVHGMGFAGMLGAFDLNPGEFLAALLSFNLGVEFGQLTILAVAFLVCFKLLVWKGYHSAVRIPFNVAISGVALVWFVQRLV